MSKFSRWPYVVAGVAVALLATFIVGYIAAPGERSGASPAGPPAAGAAEPAGEQQNEVQWWTCSMHPNIRRPKPGLCPICGMPLIPVRESSGAAGSLRQFVTSEAARQLMRIQVSPVERRFVETEVRLVGKITYDESRLKYITAWVPGRLQRLFVDFTGVSVAPGDHMVEIYSPELLAAQEELLQAKAAVNELKSSRIGVMRQTADKTVEAAREKLRLWGLTLEQIAAIEQRGAATDYMTIYAPVGGIVVHKNATEGMYVQPGTKLYTIADLSRVWLMLYAYESDLMWLRYGQDVRVSTEAYPGETFHGKILFIDPVVDPKTRTVKVRVDVPNADLRLKPDMFAHSVVKATVALGGRVMSPDLVGKWICPMHPEVIKDAPGECDICGMPLVTTASLGYVSAAEEEQVRPLAIPVSAALVTGTRAVVYVEVPDAEKPTFEGREIVLGPRAGDYYLVRAGLEEGELVVTNGNFKIDSALQIEAKPSMMTPEGGGGGGHQHGGSAMAMPAAEGESRPEMETMGLSRAVRQQLHAVMAAADRIGRAVESGSLDEARAAYRALGEAVEQVSADLPDGHPKLMWKELSMLLRNDAVEGADAADLADARRVLALVRRNVERIRGQFGLAHERGQAAVERAGPATVPLAFRMQLNGLWGSYGYLAGSLAADDGAAAARAVADAQAALDGLDMMLLSGQAHMDWMEALNGLQADLAAAAAAGQDLGALRAAFDPLSEDMADAIRRFGVAPDESVHQMHCPMAFDGKGANWLQANTETRNPYFGAAMLTCGDLVATLTEGPAALVGGN